MRVEDEGYQKQKKSRYEIFYFGLWCWPLLVLAERTRTSEWLAAAAWHVAAMQ
jgi:hypothetical protein